MNRSEHVIERLGPSTHPLWAAAAIQERALPFKSIQDLESGLRRKEWFVHGRSMKSRTRTSLAHTAKGITGFAMFSSSLDVAMQYSALDKGRPGQAFAARPTRRSTVFDMAKSSGVKRLAALLKEWMEGPTGRSANPEWDRLLDAYNGDWEKLVGEVFNPVDVVNHAAGFDNPDLINDLWEATRGDFFIVGKGAVALDTSSLEVHDVTSLLQEEFSHLWQGDAA